MLSIGNKKYRNLQEQVGYNTEEIEKIKDLIDGIVIDDKLVVIDSASGSLSEAQMEVLDGPLAFISYNEKVYLKTSESLTELVFKAIDIKAEEIGSSYFNVGGSKVVITIATKVYTVSDDLIITTYSKSQIDSIVANINTLLSGKIGLSDLVLSNIKDSAGNSRFIESDFTPDVISGVSYVYKKWSLSGTHLMIVMSGIISANSGNISPQRWANIVLPNWLSNKIIPTYGAYIGAMKGQIITADTYETNDVVFNVDRSGVNLIIGTANTIFDDASKRYFRFALDLLIDSQY